MLNFMWREPTNAHDSEALFHLREWQRSSSSTAPYQGPQNRPFGVIIKLWPLTSICASGSAALAPLPLTRVHKIDHSVQKVFRKYMRVTAFRAFDDTRLYGLSRVQCVQFVCIYVYFCLCEILRLRGACVCKCRVCGVCVLVCGPVGTPPARQHTHFTPKRMT